MTTDRKGRARFVARWNGLALVACTLLSVCTTGAAQAQLLGRMKRAVQDRVAEPARRDEPAPSGSRASARIEITPARLDAFVGAMRPLVERARLVQAEREMQAAYDTRQQEYDACVERVMRTTNGASAPMTPERVERLGVLTEQITALMGRYNAAASSGNVAQLSAILDSADAVGARARIVQYPSLSTCGVPAARPTKTAPMPENQGELIAAGAGGMTAGEFGRLRERVAVYLLTHGGGDTYDDGERQALSARETELASLAPLFRSGVLEWAQWRTLARAWRAQ